MVKRRKQEDGAAFRQNIVMYCKESSEDGGQVIDSFGYQFGAEMRKVIS
jgi:hypothetical protein